jgi:predicted kinase
MEQMPKKSKLHSYLTVTMDAELYGRLKNYCDSQEVSMKKVTEVAVKTLLERLEKEEVEIINETVLRKKQKKP